MGRGPLGSEDQGECAYHFPCPSGPQGACWAPKPGLLPSKDPSGCIGPRGLGAGKEGGRVGETDRVGGPSEARG